MVGGDKIVEGDKIVGVDKILGVDKIVGGDKIVKIVDALTVAVSLWPSDHVSGGSAELKWTEKKSLKRMLKLLFGKVWFRFSWPR